MNEYTDADVERAAAACFESAKEDMRFPGPFDTAPEPLKDTYRKMARAVIAALKGAGYE